MRTTTAGELTTLAANARVVTYRVKVENGSGTMKDLSTWVARITWDLDIDQPVSGATVYFVRANGTTQSLSPLRSDSTLNVEDDLVTFSAQLKVGRKLTIETATTAIGAAIVAGDYKLNFSGVIDVTNFEDDPVSVFCRDDGGLLVDRWIGAQWASYQTFQVYGTVGGRDVEDVMQDILDDAVNAGAVVPVSPSVTLNTPVSPVALITEYKQGNQSVMDALQALAAVPGWDVRYKYDETSGTFLLTLSEPDRSKTVPDYTFGPSQYFKVVLLNIDRTKVRNFLDMHYYDVAAAGRTSLQLGDGTSQADYGFQYMGIEEPDDSPINTATEANRKLTAMLADLKDPKAEQEIELPFFWPAELGDLYRHSANAVHYNGNQDFAVVRIEHELSPGSHRTRLKTRGSPAGAHVNWLRPPRPTPIPDIPRLITPTGVDLINPVTSTTTPDLTVLGQSIESHGVGPDQSLSRNRCGLFISAPQSIATGGSPSAVLFNSEFYDNGGLHSIVSNTERIVIPASGAVGTWIFSAEIEWAANATGRREVIVFKNAATVMATSRVLGFSSGGQGPRIVIPATDSDPMVGDYYWLAVFQDSGAGLNVTTAFFYATHLW